MVDRCLINNTTPAIVVDLDGTLVRGNTLIIYLMCGLRHLLSSGHVLSAIKLIMTVVKRQLRVISHETMKQTILSALSPHTAILDTFRRKATKRQNRDVTYLIEAQQRAGHRVLLATAAPAFYVRTIWPGDFVATDFSIDRLMLECRGDEKLKKVKQWLDSNGCYLDTVVTDHFDDAPLLKANAGGTNILVNPDRKTLIACQKAGINISAVYH